MYRISFLPIYEIETNVRKFSELIFSARKVEVRYSIEIFIKYYLCLGNISIHS